MILKIMIYTWKMQDFGNIVTEHEEMFTKKGIKINAGIYVLENNVENTKEK